MEWGNSVVGHAGQIQIEFGEGKRALAIEAQNPLPALVPF